VGSVSLGVHETLVILARADSPGSATNTATITHADQFDQSPGNNSSSVVVTASEVVRVAPPAVTSLQRFGYHAQPTEFVLTFSSALDPARAQDVHNYTLAPIGPHGRLGRQIRIVSAVYNSATRTVTLHPAILVYIFQSYRLVVNGMAPDGLASPSGTLLDGAGNGKPGSNYVKVFGRSILAGPNSQIAPQTHQEIRHLPSSDLPASRVFPRSPRAASARRIGHTQTPVPKAEFMRLPTNAVDAALESLVSPVELSGHDRTRSRS
jgi:hypothetical protein